MSAAGVPPDEVSFVLDVRGSGSVSVVLYSRILLDPLSRIPPVRGFEVLKIK